MKTPDRIDVARHALGQALTHPATWAPFLPVAGAYAFIGVPWWVCLPLLLVVVVLLCALWSRAWPRLVDQSRTELLAAHRMAENAQLKDRIQKMALAGRRQTAVVLLQTVREGMDIKHAVEERLFADGVITTHEEEVSQMVGELVRTMVGEAERLTLAEGGEISRAAAERFDKAAATLRRAYAEIDVILDPVPEDLRLPAENDALSRASERLDERLAQAQGVRRHLQRTVIVQDVDAPAEAEIIQSPAPKEPPLAG